MKIAARANILLEDWADSYRKWDASDETGYGCQSLSDASTTHSDLFQESQQVYSELGMPHVAVVPSNVRPPSPGEGATAAATGGIGCLLMRPRWRWPSDTGSTFAIAAPRPERNYVISGLSLKTLPLL